MKLTLCSRSSSISASFTCKSRPWLPSNTGKILSTWWWSSLGYYSKRQRKGSINALPSVAGHSICSCTMRLAWPVRTARAQGVYKRDHGWSYKGQKGIDMGKLWFSEKSVDPLRSWPKTNSLTHISAKRGKRERLHTVWFAPFLQKLSPSTQKILYTSDSMVQ